MNSPCSQCEKKLDYSYHMRKYTSQVQKLKKTSQLLAILFVVFIQLSDAAVLFQEGDSAEFSETRLPNTTDCNLALQHGSGVMHTFFAIGNGCNVYPFFATWNGCKVCLFCNPYFLFQHTS